MGQDVKINRETVKSAKTAINALVAGPILQVGAQVVAQVGEALRESGGLGIASCKAYMKQEQETMEEFGVGLDYMIEHIDMAAEDMKVLDETYAKKRIDE